MQLLSCCQCHTDFSCYISDCFHLNFFCWQRLSNSSALTQDCALSPNHIWREKWVSLVSMKSCVFWEIKGSMAWGVLLGHAVRGEQRDTSLSVKDSPCNIFHCKWRRFEVLTASDVVWLRAAACREPTIIDALLFSDFSWTRKWNTCTTVAQRYNKGVI